MGLLARGRGSLRPDKLVRRFGQVSHVLLNAASHRSYSSAMRDARRHGLSRDPLLGMKYLGEYLAAFLSTDQRRRVIIDHYAILADRLDPSARIAWADGLTLWRKPDAVDGMPLVVDLRTASLSPLEGESELRFRLGERCLFTLTFTLIEGATIGLQAGPAMFIGGIQGGVDCRDEIRAAAKANHEIAPSAVLLAAAKALAATLGVDRIVGIGSEGQAAMGYAGAKIRLSYDAMWLEAGAVSTDAGFFIVAPEDSAHLAAPITSSHPSRTRRKRALRAALRNEIEATATMLLSPLAMAA